MSAQIIIPGPQANKRSDVYVMVLTKQLEVCPGHLILAIVSTRIDNPGSADPFAECAPGYALLGDIKVRMMDDENLTEIFVSFNFCLLASRGAGVVVFLE